jgi:hypothetical protein
MKKSIRSSLNDDKSTIQCSQKLYNNFTWGILYHLFVLLFLSAYNSYSYSSKLFIRLIEKKMAVALLTIRHNFHLYN